MYLSAGISSVCLWKDSIWKGDIAQADSAFTGGDGVQSAVKECQTQGF